MNIVFVGSVVDKETIKELSDASVAGNKMQLGFIKGFYSNGVSIQTISAEPNGMWMFNGKKMYVCAKHLSEGSASIQTVSYINIPVAKQICIYVKLSKELKRVVSKDTVVFVYNTMSMFALPVIKTARRKKCKCVAIVADLPIKGNKSFVRKFEDRLQEKLIGRFDYLVPLTRFIAEDFAPNIPFCVIEAGVDPFDYSEESKTIRKHFNIVGQKNIVFSGTLNHLSGIELLLATMEMLKNESVVLHVYGDGPQKSLVEEYAKQNGNVSYHGRVDNQTMIEIQGEADLLACPRCSDDHTTKYTFPSKILEYICSGTPVLANRLYGIPIEYDEYINYSRSEQPEDWARAVLDILKKNNRFYVVKATRARAEVMLYKSWSAQCARVKDFLLK